MVPLSPPLCLLSVSILHLLLTSHTRIKLGLGACACACPFLACASAHSCARLFGRSSCIIASLPDTLQVSMCRTTCGGNQAPLETSVKKPSSGIRSMASSTRAWYSRSSRPIVPSQGSSLCDTGTPVQPVQKETHTCCLFTSSVYSVSPMMSMYGFHGSLREVVKRHSAYTRSVRLVQARWCNAFPIKRQAVIQVARSIAVRSLNWLNSVACKD